MQEIGFTEFQNIIKNNNSFERKPFQSAVQKAVSGYIENVNFRLEGVRGHEEENSDIAVFFFIVSQEIKITTGNKESESYLETLLSAWVKGKGSLEKAFKVYYWFCFHCKQQEYCRNITQAIFGKHVDIVQYITEANSVDIEPTENVRKAKIKNLEIQNPFEGRQYFTIEEWLNPANQDFLPYIGRENEINLLNDFANHKDQFKIWAIVASSGAGKTRLCHHWRKQSVAVRDWEQLRLQPDNPNDMNVALWRKWQPQQNTLVIIDYMFGFADVIQAITQQCTLNPNGKKVRLLVLDRIFPDDLKDLRDDLRWSPVGVSGSRNLAMGNLFFQREPLDLSSTKDQENIIRGVIRCLAGEDAKEKDIDEAAAHLNDIKDQSAWHPLFAALTGTAIREGKDFRKWNRSDLIASYLQGRDRLPWENKDIPGSKWAGYFIAAATVRRGVSYELLKECIPENEAPDFKPIRDICERITSQSVTDEVHAFQPDILGENFFLSFLEFLMNQEKKENIEVFIRMISIGDKETQKKYACSFISFLENLVRNLSNDKEGEQKVQKSWVRLIEFLNCKNFPEGSIIRWGASCSLISILYFNKIKETNDHLLNINNLSYIDYTIISILHEKEYIIKSLEYSTKYFDISLGYEDYIERGLDVIETLASIQQSYIEDYSSGAQLRIASYFGCLDAAEYMYNKYKGINSVSAKGDSALIKATSKFYNENVINFLIKKGADKSIVNHEGYTALSYACARGDIRLVNCLICDNIVNKKDDISAFISPVGIAALHGHTNIVTLLLRKGYSPNSLSVYFNVTTNIYCSITPITLAALGDKIEVVLLLLEEEDIDVKFIDSMGLNCLMQASITGCHEIIELILKKDSSIVDNQEHTTKSTALMLASHHKHKRSVQVLLKYGADKSVRNNAEETAFSLACKNGSVDIASILISKNSINEEADGLIGCCLNGHIPILHFLIESDINLDLKNHHNDTALMISSIQGNYKICRIIINHGANVHIRNRKGFNALDCACTKRKDKVIISFLEADKSGVIEFSDEEIMRSIITSSFLGFPTTSTWIILRYHKRLKGMLLLCILMSPFMAAIALMTKIFLCTKKISNLFLRRLK